jgi:hypothetical protein
MASECFSSLIEHLFTLQLFITILVYFHDNVKWKCFLSHFHCIRMVASGTRKRLQLIRRLVNRMTISFHLNTTQAVERNNFQLLIT